MITDHRFLQRPPVELPPAMLRGGAGFPRWSWTGWKGSVDWAFEEAYWAIIQGDLDIQVRVELQNGRVVPWTAFQHSYT